MDDLDFDRRLGAWMREDAPEPSAQVLRTVVAHARAHAPAHGLRALLYRASGAVALPRPAVAVLRPVTLLILLALALALGSFVYGRLQHTVVVPVASPTESPTTQPTSTPSRVPASAAPNTYACPRGATPDLPGPADQVRPPAAGPAGYSPATSTRYAFDRQSGRLVMYEASPAAGALPAIWTFDVCTNTWLHSSAAFPPDWAGPAWAMAYRDATDLTLIFGSPLEGGGGLVLGYDADTDTLTPVGMFPDALQSGVLHAVYRAATGEVIVRDDHTLDMWAYDAAGNWRQLDQAGDVPAAATSLSLLAYDRSVDRLILYTNAADSTSRQVSYQFDFGSSTWTDPTPVQPVVMFPWGDIGYGEIAYDETHARTVVFSRGVAIAYDAVAGEWQVVYDSPLDPMPPSDANDISHRQDVTLVYDPVNERVLSLGGRRFTTDWFDVDDVIAFDLDSRRWITLLAPTEGS
jgi:hypothetical protein